MGHHHPLACLDHQMAHELENAWTGVPPAGVAALHAAPGGVLEDGGHGTAKRSEGGWGLEAETSPSHGRGGGSSGAGAATRDGELTGQDVYWREQARTVTVGSD